MFNNNIPFISLDASYNIVEAHDEIKEKYNGLLMPDFFRNLLSGYDIDHFVQPVELNTSLLNMSDVRLVFVKDGDLLKCFPVKSETYGTDGARNVHYQLREPISSIFAIMPILADRVNKADSAKAFSNMEIINQQSYKMLRNVSNISLASRIMAGSLPVQDTVNFSQLLENLAASVKTVERSISIDLDIDRDVYIYINQSFITNAVLNLIANSINFKTDENVEISVKLKRADKKAVFTYSDNSKGIKDEHLPNVFKPYYSKDPFADGEVDPALGLGLFIAKSAFEHAGGKILLTSVFGKGVKYTVSLPEVTPEGDILESRATDFLLNRYSELFVQLCDSCQLPSLK